MVIVNESLTLTQFDYQQIDTPTANFLKQKEINIKGIAKQTFTDLGKELKEAQDHLSQRGYGYFEQWYTALGFKKQTVYNYINYYKLIVQQLDERDIIETLPKPMVYEIAKPSTPEEIKRQVLDGEITSTKELQEAIKARKEAEKKAQEAEQRARDLERKLTNQKPAVIEKTVVSPEMQNKVNRLEDENKNLREKAFNLESKLTQRESEERARFQNARLNQKALDQEFQFLIGKVNLFLKDVSGYVFLADVLLNMNPAKANEHETALNKLDQWVKQMKNALPNGEAIEIEGVIVNE